MSCVEGTSFAIDWSEITPQEAHDHALCCVEGSPIRGPVNELGEECPWPWDPQQLGGAPLGQYHCPYCGGMSLAGVPHFDDDRVPHPRLPR